MPAKKEQGWKRLSEGIKALRSGHSRTLLVLFDLAWANLPNLGERHKANLKNQDG